MNSLQEISQAQDDKDVVKPSKKNPLYSVSSLVVPKMEDEFSGTDAGKNSK